MAKAMAIIEEKIDSGELKVGDLIRKCEEDVKLGLVDPSVLTFTISYWNLIERAKKDKYVCVEELVKMGLYKDVDEILKVAERNNIPVCAGIPVSCPIPTDEDERASLPDGAAIEAECVICRTRPKNVISIPCGHVSSCLSCAYKNLKKDTTCVVCRQEIRSINRIYN